MTTRDDHCPPAVHGFAVRAFGDENHCGDKAVTETNGCRALLAVIDGLGHGRHAEAAAEIAAETLGYAPHADPTRALQLCHTALRTSRGAAISIALVDHEQVQWVAVGNVQGVIHHAQTRTTTRLVTRAGIVGSRLPQLRSTAVSIAPDDHLVMFTDGVAEAAARELPPSGSPSMVANWLLERHATATDDALVLAARCQAGNA